jgi:hypothetical protein
VPPVEAFRFDSERVGSCSFAAVAVAVVVDLAATVMASVWAAPVPVRRLFLPLRPESDPGRRTR